MQEIGVRAALGLLDPQPDIEIWEAATRAGLLGQRPGNKSGP